MNPRSSFIFSSEMVSKTASMAALLLWTALWLACVDLALNLTFAYPSDPKQVKIPTLQQYFEYGRSSEGKLRRMTRTDRTKTAPITLAGWYKPLAVNETGDATAPNVMTIYGMSHANLLGDAVARTGKAWKVRRITAPGGPLNWAYGAFLRDTDKSKGKVVVLAIMSVGVPALTSTTSATFSPDLQIPYTYDRFVLTGESIKRIAPPYESFEDYTATLYSPGKWRDYLQFLSLYDDYYDPLIFTESVFDYSALLRLLRRAFIQHSRQGAHTTALGRTNFNPDSEAVRLANAIVEQFAADARAAGLLPVLYVVDNAGYSDTLYRALQPSIAKSAILVLDSNMVASANEPRNYLPDSHFTPDVDDRLARRLIELIEGR